MDPMGIADVIYWIYSPVRFVSESTVYMWAIEALTIPVHLWAQEHIQQNPALHGCEALEKPRRIDKNHWQFPRLELLPLPLLLFLSPKDLQSYSPKSWGFFPPKVKRLDSPHCVAKGQSEKCEVVEVGK